MKIGLISDIHDSPRNLLKALNKLDREHVDLIACGAGDVVYYGPKSPVPDDSRGSAELINKFHVPFIFARGNCDAEPVQILLKYQVLSEQVLIYTEGLHIIFVPGYYINNFNEEGAKLGADILITGHTHKPIVEEFSQVIHLNPGSISIPLGETDKKLSPLSI
jgi:putative phosphoesterase